MAFRSISGSRLVGQGKPQQTPITLDVAVYEGAIAYGDDGNLYFSNGTAWLVLEDSGGAVQGLTGIQGTDGLQGGYGPGFTVVGSVADVDSGGDPQATLNAAFSSPSTGDAVIDEADDELWVYNGSSWVNVGSFRGVQGFQGDTGVQGLQGTLGNEGIQGRTGFRGFQGTQGFQGSTGIQGTQGIQGLQGTQGVQGIQGTTGIQGDVGDQGTQGVQGPQSIQGTTGIQGDLGIQGTTGSYGGISFEYGFSTDVTATDPGNSNIKYNNSDQANATLIYINENANPGARDISDLLNAFDSLTNPVKASIKITKVSDTSVFALWDITNITDNTGWFTFNVTSIGQSGAFVDADDVIISFVESGAQGIQGPQGTQGLQGVQGFVGFQGVQGPQSLQGTQGIQGTTGIQGLQGVQGFTGAQGTQGVQGLQGHQGVQGGSGFQGMQGTDGNQGTQGLQGQIGYNGGLTYMWGFNNSTTEGFPGLNSWLLNNSDVTLATKLYIDDLTDSGRRVDELFNYLDAVTSNPKGQIFIRTPKDNTGGYQFLIFEYTDWVWGVTGTGSDWGHFVISLVEQSELGGTDLSPGTDWDAITGTYGTDAVFTFNPSGNAGSQGAQGTQGHQGVQGLQGVQGTQGPQSIQGTTGIQGAQGIQGVEGARDFTVTNLSSIAYVIDGVNNPDLNLLRGFTYRFIVNAPGHPFEIRSGSASGSAYNTGVTNNGTDSGEITFRVPGNAPDTLYYSCTVHAGMNGQLNISDLGPQGIQGVQGFQGTDGIQGNDGLQGTTGAGAQGAQGIQGDLGFQGTQGFPGPIGPQGIQGTSGLQGGGGVQGATGSFGGVTFDYTWNSQTTLADPGIGNVSVNNSTYASANVLLIDDRDDNFTLLVPFLQTIDDSTSPIKGHVKITSKTNVDQFILFAINSLTDENGYFNVSVSYISGSVSGTWSNGEDVTITFARTGDIGPVGPQGIQGFEGFQGAQGLGGGVGGQGTQGLQGLQGGPGPQGTPGFIGGDGIQGAQGLQGPQGAQGTDGTDGDEGIQGNDGFQGTQGLSQQGTQGFQGSQGIAGIGATGIQGFQGIQGDALQGHQGTQGNSGPPGFGNQGIQGMQGFQGTIGGEGIQGVQGLGGQGTSGLQGIQGTDGEEGLQGVQGETGDGNQGTQGFQGAAGIGNTGVQGNDGTQGVQGIIGESGVGGTQGVQGFDGSQGFQGIGGGLGDTGNQGVQGIQGGPGFQGDTGAGSQGIQGGQGIQGLLGIQGFPGQGTQGLQGTQAAQGVQGERGFQGTQGMQGFGPAGAVTNIQNVHETSVQDTALFITMVEGGNTTQPLRATTGPNPGGESNFFYTSDVDELTVENLQVEGNVNVVGSITADSFTASGASDFHLASNNYLSMGNTAASPYSRLGWLTTNNSVSLEVNTSVTSNFVIKPLTGSNLFTFQVATGNFTATGDIESNSDIRLKENIETIPNALEKVSNMRGVYFDMKSRPGVRKVGLIAQEVEEVLPEVVSAAEDGEQIKSVAYGNIVGLLVEAVKELKDEIEQLKNQ